MKRKQASVSRKFITGVFATLCSLSLQAQINGDVNEAKLYAESKQVNQFFRRFNGEEDEKGNRYYPGDKLYRSTKLRKKYLGILFDESNAGIGNNLKVEFASAVLEKPETTILTFQSPNWFAEVQTTFEYNGKSQKIILFMTIEKDHLGSKWVINNAYTELFKNYFVRDTSRLESFLHPMSHELDFMNLRKAFAKTDSISQYTTRKFRPDYLTLILYEIRRKNLKFKSVDFVKFHIFQIDGWYFELMEFNRSGFNTGWLISSLVKLNNEAEKKILYKYLHYETR